MPNRAQCPAKVVRELTALGQALDAAIPPKQLDRNLLIGTWNIRAFGDLADEWTLRVKGKSERGWRALEHISEIVSRLDVVAIQEVRGNLRCLRHMMKTLGPDWAFILTDVNRGPSGNDERLAFVFDTRRVKPSGLACELVLPQEVIAKAGAGDLDRQFARTPYGVSFLSADQTFLLVTVHIMWGSRPRDRLPELKGIAQWAANWAGELESWGHNLLVLGDFNIDRAGDGTLEAFMSTGLTVPDALNHVPRTIFPTQKDAFYDQIAWFEDPKTKVRRLSMQFSGAAGGFDFVPHVFTELDPQAKSWQISDHYPLWCEFLVERPETGWHRPAVSSDRSGARGGSPEPAGGPR